MANFFQCCKRHTINFDLICYTEEQHGNLYVSFANGKNFYLKGKCKELVEQSLTMMAYYQKNL
jgi:hypothetical protein